MVAQSYLLTITVKYTRTSISFFFRVYQIILLLVGEDCRQLYRYQTKITGMYVNIFFSILTINKFLTQWFFYK